MRRRRYLAALGLAGATGLAGCAGYVGSTAEETPTRSPSSEPVQVGDVTLPVDRSELFTALHRDGIPAITDPAFGADWTDWSAVAVEHRPPAAERPTLPDEFAVVGVERGGEARAYPLAVLDWHEVVNDVFEPPSTARRPTADGALGGALLVTYCPLCGSGVVAERVVDGEPTTFGVSGMLWRDDLVLYDRATDSLWSQLLATAIRGPKTGTQLRLVPSTLSSWGEWRTAHPETRVLLPPPGSVAVDGRRGQVRDYGDSKYGYETQSQLVGFDSDGEGLGERTLVAGVDHEGVARAYPFPVVRGEDVVNDRVGGLPVVVALAPGGTLVAYDRRVDGGTLRFEAADDRHLCAGGSRWERTTGRAADGPYDGARLAPTAAHTAMFWSAWVAFHPDTTVYGR
ncbi:DUF3179 domain-containing protein [Salinirubellus salinus]|uniref:DUF3179 domain-containing protein n=1 Tax=Salinirubellus salinus TaxID=1364945 RepID=A0A9E7U4E0_9EURY|nr:DUF3179 domain-containing protein [Salinirubellus salinus]UWM54195.1 DUF3179 domain-containing protein [Salinirubellus salinus]